jgi:hypothetical protein
MTFMRTFFVGLLITCASASLLAADSPTLDAAKYPQDTPQKALSSLVKCLGAKDYAYWIGHLITPADAKTTIEKHGTLEKAVEFLSDEKHSAQMQERKELMQKMLDANSSTEGEDNGVKWTRFQSEGRVLQLEKQADGRWCMNLRNTGKK